MSAELGVFDWTAVDADPTNPQVRAAILAELRQIRRPSVFDKYDVVREFVKDRRVLDLGIVDHTAAGVAQPHWLHGKIKGWAKEVVGVDIVEKEVLALRARGFDVVAADATSDLDIGRRFERVVMGDLLEHVSDQVKLVQFAARHLEPGGRILATTPNPFYYAWLYESIRLGACIANAEHMTWAGPTMALEIARRAGVRLVEYRLLRPRSQPGSWRTKLVEGLSERYFREQELFAQSYVYVFEAPCPSASS